MAKWTMQAPTTDARGGGEGRKKTRKGLGKRELDNEARKAVTKGVHNIIDQRVRKDEAKVDNRKLAVMELLVMETRVKLTENRRRQEDHQSASGREIIISISKPPPVVGAREMKGSWPWQARGRTSSADYECNLSLAELKAPEHRAQAAQRKERLGLNGNVSSPGAIGEQNISVMTTATIGNLFITAAVETPPNRRTAQVDQSRPLEVLKSELHIRAMIML